MDACPDGLSGREALFKGLGAFNTTFKGKRQEIFLYDVSLLT
jgi:hypothetical protein